MLKMIKTTTLTTLAALTLTAGISTQANAATPQITGPSVAQTTEFQVNDQILGSVAEFQTEDAFLGSADNDIADVTLVANRRGFSSRRGFRSRGFSSRRGFNRGFNRGFGHSKFNRSFGHSKFKKKGFSSRRGFRSRGFKKKSFGKRHF